MVREEHPYLEDDHLLVALLVEHLTQEPAEVARQLVIARIARSVLLRVVDVSELERRKTVADLLLHLFNHTIQHGKIAVLTENDVNKDIVLWGCQSID